MLKLIIGNKAYSSWSLRGWLAVKQSGLPFEEITVPMFDEEWDRRTQGDEFAPSGGKVPILWDDKTVIWDSLAIIEWLADRTDRARFWPKDDAARGMARSMAAEMHASFANLRSALPMNLKVRHETFKVWGGAQADIERVTTIWRDCLQKYGGPYLFGTFGAADIMYAPVVTRFVTYSVPVPRFAATYMETILDHAWMKEWIEAAQEEPWVIEQYEPHQA